MDNQANQRDRVRRWRRTAPILGAASLAVGLVCSACVGSGTSSASTTAPKKPAATAPKSATTHGGIKAASSCLAAHGVPLARARVAFGQIVTTKVPTVSDRTLQSAGTACQARLSSKSAAFVKKVDTCIAGHGIKIAKTKSPLTNILLLNPSSTHVKSDVSACVTAARPTV